MVERTETKMVIVLGPPGSGKSTLSRSLAAIERFGLLETGEILREHVRRNGPFAETIKPYINAGRLVPHAVVKDLLMERVRMVNNDVVILDGYPRTAEELDELEMIQQQGRLKMGLILILSADQAILGWRLASRHRQDDVPDVIQNRVLEYQNNTAPVIEQLWKRYPGQVRTVNAAQSKEGVLNSAFEQLWMSGIELVQLP